MKVSQPPDVSVEESKRTKGDRVDVALHVSAVVTLTLKDVVKLPPIPGLSKAVDIAVAIADTVQVS